VPATESRHHLVRCRTAAAQRSTDHVRPDHADRADAYGAHRSSLIRIGPPRQSQPGPM